MSAPVVKTKYGALRGAVVQNVEGGQYLAFNGIPYAEPPVGQLRFKEPQPPKAWSGIRDARKEGSAAIQFDLMEPTSEIIGSEDCLYLNVSTNSLSGKRAVMVWIHGGGFFMGSGSGDGPDYLLKHDIVFVSINYRLHAFGFLNMDDVEAAGNQGLKDQVAALKWVQENIEAFGGDPQNVTISGVSAGSVSVHYLALSPLAKGLFHKAIGQSGSILNTWAYKRNNKESGLRLAALLGLETTDGKEAAQFLRTVDAKTLTQGVIQLSFDIENPPLHIVFQPTMDDKSENPFAAQPVDEMVKKGIEVPSIFGYNSHEGILFLAESPDDIYSILDNDFDGFFDKLIPNQNITKTDDVVKSVRKYYFGEEPITPEQRDNYVQLTGDFHFVFGIRRTVEIQSQKRVPIYFYRFSASVENPLIRNMLKLDVEGTCHGDEIGCIFYDSVSKLKLEPDSKDRVTMERFTKMWTNFAKTGDPTPKLDNVITKKWLPVTKQEVNYLEISDELISGVNLDQEKWEFWKSISELTMNAPIVKTRYGVLKGTVVQNVEGGQYLAFNGIPYAEPPVGQLRFKEPQPPKAWSGIRDARKEGSAAIQVDMMKPTPEIIGSEDCLYLNVSTNSLSGKRAVMVWIHGGGFAMGSGSSDLYSPDYLLKHDIVFVSINYRLHVLGFLNMDDVEAAGNQGLKDQVAALKWVQENIEAFGGDPQNVTIFGDSAGSASVHYLTVSPLAKGLFHKAIGQSGSILNTWAYKRNNKESGLRLAALLGLETTDGKEAAQFLRTVDAKTLTQGVTQLSTDLRKPSLSADFVPTMDDKSENPLAAQPAAELAKKGIQVPSIFGYNSHEGILLLAGSTDEIYSILDKDFDGFLDELIVNQNITKTDDVVKSVRKYYFGEEPITPQQRDNYVQLTGDFHFVFGIRRTVEIQSQKIVPMYFYRFSAPVEHPFVRNMLKIDAEGTCHGDELSCIFYGRVSSSKLEPDSKDRVTMERFTRLWTNFAKTGDPTPKLDNVITKKWLPVTKQEINYLEINEDVITGVNPDKEKWEFWKSISESA